MRATGRRQLVQLGWLYRRPVDPEGIARFHRNFGRGLAGRRIERSPLPFGRHRWVAAPDPAPLKFSEIVRPGEELGDWFDERSQIPVDPEHGPGWHMAVQPFSAGATAVTVVGSHCLLDGVAVLTAAAHAADDRAEPMDWPPPRSRSPVRAVLADLAQTCRDIPDLVAAARAGPAAGTASPPTSSRPPAPSRGRFAAPSELAGVGGNIGSQTPGVDARPLNREGATLRQREDGIRGDPTARTGVENAGEVVPLRRRNAERVHRDGGAALFETRRLCRPRTRPAWASRPCPWSCPAGR